MTSDDEAPPGAANRFRTPSSPDWRALVGTRANVLVEGRRASLDEFLDLVRPILHQPIASVECGSAMSLVRAPTMVLVNVDRLDATGQRALHEWLTDAHNADSQIIALSSVALFPLVKAGVFDRQLYYRLNTIFVELEVV